MDEEKMKARLRGHIRLCKSNLRSPRVKCCAGCPFEEIIVSEFPELKNAFRAKRAAVNPHIFYAEDHN